MTDRPVYGITVLRYADGRTELREGVIHDDKEYPGYWDSWPMPTAWQHRHAMLIDACELVKREAGVTMTISIGEHGWPRFTDGNGNPLPEEPAFQAGATIASAEQEGAE